MESGVAASPAASGAARSVRPCRPSSERRLLWTFRVRRARRRSALRDESNTRAYAEPAVIIAVPMLDATGVRLSSSLVMRPCRATPSPW